MRIKDYVTSGKAAKMLGVNIDTLRKGSYKNLFKAYLHPNGYWRMYRKDDIEKFLEEQNIKERK